MNDWIYEQGKSHLQDLHREAEAERMKNRLPKKENQIQHTLKRLLGLNE